MNKQTTRTRLTLMGALVVTATLGGCTDDGTTTQEDATTNGDNGVVMELFLRLTVDGTVVDPGQRLFYSRTLTEERRQALYERYVDRADEFTEPIVFLDHENQRVWWVCDTHFADAEERGDRAGEPYCAFRVPAPYSDPADNKYDLRIQREADGSVLEGADSWVSTPEAWLSGTFDFTAEIGPVEGYEARFEGRYPETLLTGDEYPIEVVVEGDEVSATGWVQRHGLIDEDL